MLATPMTVSALFADLSVYVIPTFQRPYAWEKEQWNELIEDIQNAAGKSPPYRYHYFAPLHMIKVDPNDELWERYVDQTCPDICSLKSKDFRDRDFQQLSVFLVVDGQQRLITLYSLLHVISAPHISNFINLANGVQIPRVILNPPTIMIGFVRSSVCTAESYFLHRFTLVARRDWYNSSGTLLKNLPVVEKNIYFLLVTTAELFALNYLLQRN